MLSKNQLSSYKVTIVITTHNRKEKLVNTLNSILSSIYSEAIAEIIIVDDASDDGTNEMLLKKYPNNRIVKVIKSNKEILVSEARNMGSRKASGNFILFLDDDVILSSTTIIDLCIYLIENPNVACALPLILYYDRPTIIWAAGVKHNFWTTIGGLIGQNETDDGQFKTAIQSDSVMTAFMVRREASDRFKFDSKVFPIGWEDMDYTTKIKRAGYDVVVLPWVKVLHDYTRAHFLKSKLRLYYEVRNRIIFHRKWSKNALQYLMSVSFSTAVGLNYVFLSLFFAKGSNSIDTVRIVIKALSDGLLHQITLSAR